MLNRGFYAIHVMEWQRALSLLYQDHAEVLDDNLVPYDFNNWAELSAGMKEHPGGFVHTTTLRIAIPDVIRLKRYDRLPRSEVKFTRRNIYEHYGYKCCYCGRRYATNELNLDHVIPRAKGGLTEWSNIVTACIPCNARKSDKYPEEVGMKLLVSPTRPTWHGQRSLIKIGMKVKASWQKLIDAKYWDSELEKR